MSQFNDDFTYDHFITSIVREYAYNNGDVIYNFMKNHKIGESTYGQIMDAAAKGKGVIAHRLYGHHFIYDFPISDISYSGEFIEHLFSDLFTKQGIPIIPGELLEDVGLLKYCDKLKGSWNFVNGFDLLAGTVSIYKGWNEFNKAMKNISSVDDFKDFANTFGIGVLELAIALSTANPFMLIGAALHLTSGVRGLLNDGSVIYFQNRNNRLSVEFSNNALNVNEYIRRFSVKNSVKKHDLNNSLDYLRLRIE